MKWFHIPKQDSGGKRREREQGDSEICMHDWQYARKSKRAKKRERERGSERQRERERQSKRERERERERQRERESQSTFYILQVAAGPMYWVHNLNKTVGKRREREQGKGERNRYMYG